MASYFTGFLLATCLLQSTSPAHTGSFSTTTMHTAVACLDGVLQIDLAWGCYRKDPANVSANSFAMRLMRALRVKVLVHGSRQEVFVESQESPQQGGAQRFGDHSGDSPCRTYRRYVLQTR